MLRDKDIKKIDGIHRSSPVSCKATRCTWIQGVVYAILGWNIICTIGFFHQDRDDVEDVLYGGLSLFKNKLRIG